MFLKLRTDLNPYIKDRLRLVLVNLYSREIAIPRSLRHRDLDSTADEKIFELIENQFKRGEQVLLVTEDESSRSQIQERLKAISGDPSARVPAIIKVAFGYPLSNEDKLALKERRRLFRKRARELKQAGIPRPVTREERLATEGSLFAHSLRSRHSNLISNFRKNLKLDSALNLSRQWPENPVIIWRTTRNPDTINGHRQRINRASLAVACLEEHLAKFLPDSEGNLNHDHFLRITIGSIAELIDQKETITDGIHDSLASLKLLEGNLSLLGKHEKVLKKRINAITSAGLVDAEMSFLKEANLYIRQIRTARRALSAIRLETLDKYLYLKKSHESLNLIAELHFDPVSEYSNALSEFVRETESMIATAMAQIKRSEERIEEIKENQKSWWDKFTARAFDFRGFSSRISKAMNTAWSAVAKFDATKIDFRKISLKDVLYTGAVYLNPVALAAKYGPSFIETLVGEKLPAPVHQIAAMQDSLYLYVAGLPQQMVRNIERTVEDILEFDFTRMTLQQLADTQIRMIKTAAEQTRPLAPALAFVPGVGPALYAAVNAGLVLASSLPDKPIDKWTAQDGLNVLEANKTLILEALPAGSTIREFADAAIYALEVYRDPRKAIGFVSDFSGLPAEIPELAAMENVKKNFNSLLTEIENSQSYTDMFSLSSITKTVTSTVTSATTSLQDAVAVVTEPLVSIAKEVETLEKTVQDVTLAVQTEAARTLLETGDSLKAEAVASLALSDLQKKVEELASLPGSLEEKAQSLLDSVKDPSGLLSELKDAIPIDGNILGILSEEFVKYADLSELLKSELDLDFLGGFSSPEVIIDWLEDHYDAKILVTDAAMSGIPALLQALQSGRLPVIPNSVLQVADQAPEGSYVKTSALDAAIALNPLADQTSQSQNNKTIFAVAAAGIIVAGFAVMRKRGK